jgi:hypothetical protein
MLSVSMTGQARTVPELLAVLLHIPGWRDQLGGSTADLPRGAGVTFVFDKEGVAFFFGEISSSQVLPRFKMASL